MKEAKMTAEERSEGIKDEGKKGDEREQLVLIKHARSRSRPNHVSVWREICDKGKCDVHFGKETGKDWRLVM